MNQRRWGLPLRGIKSSLEIVCFQVVPERLKCIWWTDRVRKGIPNRWCSCTEGARTESKVSARDLQEVRRKRWPENTGWTVRSKRTREIRWTRWKYRELIQCAYRRTIVYSSIPGWYQVQPVDQPQVLQSRRAIPVQTVLWLEQSPTPALCPMCTRT